MRLVFNSFLIEKGMELRPDEKSEKEQVEDYIEQFSIEGMLDEVLNSLLESRPANPYTALSSLIEAKTMPEIIDILIYPCVAEGGRSGVEVKVITNLGEFSGMAGDLFDAPPGTDILREFGVQQVKISDAIKNIDPRNQKEIDDALMSLKEIDTHLLVATSIAICRAGARHTGKSLFNHIATQAEAIEQLPLPVLTAAQLQLGTDDINNKLSQDIMLYPVSTTFFDGALESLAQASQFIKLALVEKFTPESASEETNTNGEGHDGKPPHITFNTSGCCRVSGMELSELISIINSCVNSNVNGEMKPAVDMSHTAISKFIDDNVLYYPFGDASSQEGAELDGAGVIDNIMTMWRNTETISIEDPLHPDDITSLRELKNKIGTAMSEIRGDPSSSELPYALSGVGRDDSCPLQIVADEACQTASDLKKLTSEGVFNAVKIRMSKSKTVTAAIDMVKAARTAGWAIIVGCEEGPPETYDSFLADFAVGTSAMQFQGGSMENAEHACKFNRLMQIFKENDDLPFVQRDFR